MQPSCAAVAGRPSFCTTNFVKAESVATSSRSVTSAVGKVATSPVVPGFSARVQRMTVV